MNAAASLKRVNGRRRVIDQRKHFRGMNAAASLKPRGTSPCCIRPSKLPRHERRGLIEAIWPQCRSTSTPALLPRHERRGLIEAIIASTSVWVSTIHFRGMNAAASLKLKWFGAGSAADW